MTRLRSVPAMLLAFAAWAGLVPPAQAQLPLGIPIAQGVPAASGPPDWVGAGQPGFAKLIDDPRWVGAAGVSHGGAAVSVALADFRAIHKDNVLHLSWMVRFDPRVWSTKDRVYVGFAHPLQNSAAPAVLLSFKLTTEANLIANTQASNREVTCYSRQVVAGVPGWKVETTPAWAESSTAVWINDPNGRADKFENNGSFWAIHVRVPVLKNPAAADVPLNGVAGDPQGNLKLWYECQNWFTDQDGSALVHQMPYPIDAVTTNPTGLPAPTNIGTPDPYVEDTFNGKVRKWAPIHLKQPGVDPTPCSNEGIDLTWSNVGVIKNAPTSPLPTPPLVPPFGHEIAFPPAKTAPPMPAVIARNLFVAKPTNGIPGTTVGVGQLEARFRVANWGSGIGIQNPGEDLWKPLKPPGAAASANIDPILSGDTGEIRFYWEASSEDPFVQSFMDPNPTRTRHQCVLTELVPNGANFTFIKTSLYQNMDFVQASKFSREAMVSVAGVPAVTPGAKARDVFLLVRTSGMPAQIGGPVPPREPWPKPMPKSPGPVSVPVLPPFPAVNLKAEEAEQVRNVSALRQPGPDRPRKLIPEAVVRPIGKQLAEPTRPTLPSYTVYAWHDTGRTLTVDGVKARVVEPQTSFGYYVSHEGPLSGWQHTLKGAQKIGPDYYVVSPPTGGSVNVVTEIEAIEGAPGGQGVPWVCPPAYYPPVCVPQPARRPLLFRRGR